MSTKAEVSFEGYSGPNGKRFLTMTIGSQKISYIECFEWGFFSRVCQAMTEGLQHLDKYQLPPPRLTKEEQAVLDAAVKLANSQIRWYKTQEEAEFDSAVYDYLKSVEK